MSFINSQSAATVPKGWGLEHREELIWDSGQGWIHHLQGPLFKNVNDFKAMTIEFNPEWFCSNFVGGGDVTKYLKWRKLKKRKVYFLIVRIKFLMVKSRRQMLGCSVHFLLLTLLRILACRGLPTVEMYLPVSGNSIWIFSQAYPKTSF